MTENTEGGALQLKQSFGYDVYKRANLQLISNSSFVYAVGSVLHLIDLVSGERRYFTGVRQSNIGAIAIHPSKQFIAYSERNIDDPRIYLLEYPSLRLHRTLIGGAVRSIVGLSFDSEGGRLASIASDPDYMLTIWNWEVQRIVLRSKAFSQDVYSVSFHPKLEGLLTTSGMGHIKFWKMAGTFTGLKLQGAVGKFGSSELSDISSFIHLPDGKVISGTEYGRLLLWEGGFIKFEIGCKNGVPCHQGPIDVVLMEESELITGGDDGVIRVWDADSIDNGEVPENSGATTAEGLPEKLFETEPLDELTVGKDVKIKSICRYGSNSFEYIVGDANGGWWKVDMKNRSTEKIFNFHAGSVGGVDFSPATRNAVTVGRDGALQLYDTDKNGFLGRVKYAGSNGTAVIYLPKEIDPTGTTMIAFYSDGVARFIRHSRNDQSGSVVFFLIQAVKIHSSPIVTFALSVDARMLATAAEDGSLFFSQISTQSQPLRFSVEPLAFVQLDSEKGEKRRAVSLSWLPSSTNAKRRKLLVTLSDGTLLQVSTPDVSNLDTSMTLRLPFSAVDPQRFEFDFREDIHRAEVENQTVLKAKREAESQQQQQQQNEKQTSSQQQDDPEEAERRRKAEEESCFVKFEHPGAVGGSYSAQAVQSLDDDLFLLSLTDNDSGEGELRLCSWKNRTVSKVLAHSKLAPSAFNLSPSRSFILFGSLDGSFALRRLSEPLSLQKFRGHEAAIIPKLAAKANPRAYEFILPDTFVYSAHDFNLTNAINGLRFALDDSLVVSIGGEGGVFIWQNTLVTPKELAETESQGDEGNIRTIQDITDAKAYSFEDSRLKAKQDRELLSIEERKLQTRRNISRLREEFQLAVRKWEQDPGRHENIRWQLDMNVGNSDNIESMKTEKLQQVKEEYAWISEKETIGVSKLQRRFLDDILTDRVVVKCFESAHCVSTFRTVKRASTLVENDLNELEAAATQQAAAANKIRPVSVQGTTQKIIGGAAQDVTAATAQSEANQGKIVADQHGLSSPGAGKENDSSKNGAATGGNSKNRMEQRKQQRAERALQLRDLLNSKPDESFEDPNDVAAIRHAETHMGDFNLKSNENYIVVDQGSVDAETKRKQLSLLADSLLRLKENFNRLVLDSRDRRGQIIRDIERQYEEIAEINTELKQLGVDIDREQSKRYETDYAAFPERRSIVSEDDIEQMRIMEEERATAGRDEDPLGGFSGKKTGNPHLTNADTRIALRNAELMKQNRKKQEEVVSFNSRFGASLLANTRLDQTGLDLKAGVRVLDGVRIALSQLEKQELESRIAILQFRKSRVLKKIGEVVAKFDKFILRLIKERVLLQSDIKSTEMRILLLHKEWKILKEFEGTDKVLEQKLRAKLADKRDVDHRIKDCLEKINVKKIEVENVTGKLKKLFEEFLALIGESNKHEEFLTKLYKRKIRRYQKKSAGGEDGEQAEGGDDDDDMMISDDEDEVDTNFDENCPEGCDRMLYDSVLGLRERRLDLEDFMGDYQKAIDVIKKDYETLLKKDRNLVVALRSAERDIQTFQAQKQRKLNELDFWVPLKPSQVQCLNADSIQLTDAVLFVEQELVRLRQRIGELHAEKANIRRQHHELRKMHVTLSRSKKDKQVHLEDMDEHLVQVQLLKFGRIVDLDKLEKIGTNKNADELRDRMLRHETVRSKELAEFDTEIRKLKEEYGVILALNTRTLERLVDTTHKQRGLEDTLDEITRLTSNEERLGEKSSNIIKQMRAKAMEQRHQIEALKLEVLHLIRKPTKPPRYLNNDPVADLMNEPDFGSPDGIFVDTTHSRPPTSRTVIEVTDSTDDSEPKAPVSSSSDGSFDRPNAPPPSSLFEIGTLRSMAPTPSDVDPREGSASKLPQSPLLPAVTEVHHEETELTGATSAISEMDRLLKETGNLDSILGEMGAIPPLDQLIKDSGGGSGANAPDLGELLKDGGAVGDAIPDLKDLLNNQLQLP